MISHGKASDAVYHALRAELRVECRLSSTGGGDLKATGELGDVLFAQLLWPDQIHLITRSNTTSIIILERS